MEVNFYIPHGCCLATAAVIYFLAGLLLARFVYKNVDGSDRDVFSGMAFVFWPLALVGCGLYAIGWFVSRLIIAGNSG